MFNSRLTIILGFSIFALIIFDAFQQKYYVDTFNLSPEGFSFFNLFKSHSLRWLIWLIGSIPYVLFARKIFVHRVDPISNRNFFSLIASVALSILSIILVISIVGVLFFSEESSMLVFTEWVIFIFYQKMMSFVLPSSLLVLLVYSGSTKQVIEAQWLEISDLKKEVALVSNSQNEFSISIKIGNKLKVIPLNEVYWIESDDYCVKIHTKDKAYSLRKSLKSLEKELSNYKFIRVHRKALLNLSFLDHIDFSFGIVKLTDKTEVPLSKTGAQTLRKVIS